MKRNLLTLFVVLMISIMFSQTTLGQTTSTKATITGSIFDEFDNSPLIGATVMTDTLNNLGVTTNEKGVFVIKNADLKKPLKIYVYYTGYKDKVVTITPDRVNYTLQSPVLMENKMVATIVVQGTAPIAEIKGDTTQFNAGAYKTNPDATTGDLISKMPGFKVADDGTVSQQGQSITKITVDGKNYFRDDAAAALSALPAEIVQSIQLIDDKNDEDKFTGYDSGERIKTLNIVTKTKSTFAAMGDYAAGYGLSAPKRKDENGNNIDLSPSQTQNPFIFTSNTNIFSNKQSLSLGFGGNNVNQSPLSPRGYYGGRRNGITTAYGIKLNYNLEIKGGNFSTTYLFDYGNSNRQSGVVRQYNDEAMGRTYIDTTNNDGLSQNHNLSFYYEQQLNKNNKLIARPSFRYSSSETSLWRESANSYEGAPDLDNKATTNSLTSSRNYSINPNIMWFHNFSQKQFFTTSLRGTFTDNNQDQYIKNHILTRKDIENMDWNDSISNQYIRNLANGNTIDARLSFTQRFGQFSGVTMSYSATYDWSTSERKTYIWDDITQSYKDIDDLLSNTFNRNYLTNNVGVGYNYNNRTSMFNVGVNFQNSQLKNHRTYPTNDDPEKYSFNSPNVMIGYRYTINKNKNLRFMLMGRPNLPSLTQLQDVLDVTDPLNVSIGNPDLNQAFSSNFVFSYNSSNVEKSQIFSAYARLSNSMNSFATDRYTLTENTVIKGVEIQKGAQVSTTTNLNGKWSSEFGATFAFPIKSIKSNVTMDLSYDFSSSPFMSNRQRYDSKENSIDFDLRLSSNISSNLDFTIRNNIEYTRGSTNRLNSTPSNTLNERVILRLDWIFWKGFFLNVDYTFQYNNYFDNKIENNSQNILNAGIGKKFLKNSLELRISGFDILNQLKNYSSNVREGYTEYSRSNNLGRYFAFTLRFKFNTLGAGVKAPSSRGSNFRPMGGGGGSFRSH